MNDAAFGLANVPAGGAGMRKNAQGKTFVFLGISGSGKGTVAEHLQRALEESIIISTGGTLREIARQPNLMGRYIRDILDRGGLVPHWVASFLWIRKLTEELRGDEHLIFEGAPRRIEEARLMDEVMKALGRPLPVAAYLELPPRAAEERLVKRGRSDDNHRAIRARFEFFRKHVHPVIRYYRNQKRLVTINADQTRDEVWEEARRALKIL